MLENYSHDVQAALKKIGAEVGQRIAVQKGDKRYEGLLMPKAAGDPNVIVMKLDTGYNVGVAFEGAKIEKLKEESRPPATGLKKPKTKFDPSKPTIVILHAGGTIASRVDYRTGGVTPVFTAEDLLEMFPEIADFANIRAHVVFQMFSDDMQSEHWQILAKKAAEEMEQGCAGIIITHGTDTMHYTAAALSFMLQDLPIPVLIVGAQRSSDRGSSDGAMNMVCAANFIVNSDYAGVAICMHGSPSDDVCHVLAGGKVRKMHTSRRDTFQAINAKPVAKVNYTTKRIEFLQKDYLKKNPARKLRLEDKYDAKVALVKIHPGFVPEVLDFYDKNNYRGIVLEGTGLGHAPINALDDATKRHPELLKKLEAMNKKGIAIFMTSQCIFGRVNMDVYSTGRDLQKAGVTPAYMLPELALVKLGWVLGHTRDPSEVEKLMDMNIAGEIIERTEVDEFPDKDLEK